MLHCADFISADSLYMFHPLFDDVMTYVQP